MASQLPFRILTLAVYAIAIGRSVAAVVYHQTMVKLIAVGLQVPSADLWAASVATQAGYASGLVLGLPLGGMLQARRLMPAVVFTLGVDLALLSVVPSLAFFCGVDYSVGVLSIGAQLLIAQTAKTAAPEERPHIVGTLLSALFAGLVLSRALSGLIAEQIGWRSFYLMAGLTTCAVGIVLRGLIPRTISAGLRYGPLIRSLTLIWFGNPELRRIAGAGACLFTALSGVWANVASMA